MYTKTLQIYQEFDFFPFKKIQHINLQGGELDSVGRSWEAGLWIVYFRETKSVDYLKNVVYLLWEVQNIPNWNYYLFSLTS